MEAKIKKSFEAMKSDSTLGGIYYPLEGELLITEIEKKCIFLIKE
jgi:hypothetical protein